MQFTDQHLNTYLEQGFVIIERFLSEEETLAGLEGFRKFYAPSYEDYIAAGRQNETPKQVIFPWDHTGLNRIPTNPKIIDAVEQVIGTRDIRLCDCELNVTYAGEPRLGHDYKFHVDYGNNSLGPHFEDDRTNITVVIALQDITEGLAPTLLVPTGKPDEDAVKMIVPAGSICMYSTISTRHSASRITAEEGCRAVVWSSFCRKDQPWNGGRWFTYKSNYRANGAASAGQIAKFIAEATPRQLELIGFPAVDDPIWTDKFLDGMIARYPAFDPAPYRAVR